METIDITTIRHDVSIQYPKGGINSCRHDSWSGYSKRIAMCRSEEIPWDQLYGEEQAREHLAEIQKEHPVEGAEYFVTRTTTRSITEKVI